MLSIFVSASSFAQAQAKDEVPESKSKAVEFMTADGSFLVKEFYDLQKIKGVECQVLIMNNVVSGKKMGCLRLETQYRSQYSSDSYIGTLDSDELDACIQSLEYIKNTLLPSAPSVYTEAEYKTNDYNAPPKTDRFGAQDSNQKTLCRHGQQLKKTTWSGVQGQGGS